MYKHASTIQDLRHQSLGGALSELKRDAEHLARIKADRMEVHNLKNQLRKEIAEAKRRRLNR